MTKATPLGDIGGGSRSSVRPAISMSEEISAAKKLGASDAQAKTIAEKRMADPQAIPNAKENAKIAEWWKTAKPGESYTTGKGPSGTQKGHVVTNSDNHTKPVK